MDHMAQQKIQPDGDSFSYLILLMAETREVSQFDVIFTHIRTQGIYPSYKSLRRMAITYARMYDFEKVEDIQQFMSLAYKHEKGFTKKSVRYVNPQPTYFLKRLNYFKKLMEQEQQQPQQSNSSTESGSETGSSGSTSSQ